jgi:predicted Fe-Mo cluster-binding NifX family protein
MKIAIVSDDGKTISKHFGRAENYLVVHYDNDQIVGRTTLAKQGICETPHRQQGRHDPRGRGYGHRAEHSHGQMFENIRDCDVVLSRGMGRGAYQGLQSLGIRPILTDIADIESAVRAVMDDTIIDHVEMLH